jgi:hypothetical protein
MASNKDEIYVVIGRLLTRILKVQKDKQIIATMC